jgi:hypothetical protein
MEACYGETDVLERPCAVARGKDINRTRVMPLLLAFADGRCRYTTVTVLI